MLNKVISNLFRLLLVLPLMLAASSSLHAETASDAAVKSAFLYNFFKFIEWPETNNPDSFSLCSTDPNSLGDNLQMLDQKIINGKPLRVRRGISSKELASCQIVFINTQENNTAIFRELQNLPVVTVSDKPDFINEGGMIGLVPDGNRLSFAINLDVAIASRIHINAQLLKLAKTVKTAQ